MIIRTTSLHKSTPFSQFTDIVLFARVARGETIDDIIVSRAGSMLLARTRNHIAVYDLVFGKPLCGVERPPDVVREFRLPKMAAASRTAPGSRDADYADNLSFVASQFASDDTCIAAAVFRDVYVWKVWQWSFFCSRFYKSSFFPQLFTKTNIISILDYHQNIKLL